MFIWNYRHKYTSAYIILGYKSLRCGYSDLMWDILSNAFRVNRKKQKYLDRNVGAIKKKKPFMWVDNLQDELQVWPFVSYVIIPHR